MMPWWLNQVRLRSEAEGKRLLDVFTLHYYPQGGEFSDTVSASMQARRNRSTRSLWDTNYVDETWVNDRIKLIPLMKSWVASNYPGTRIGITEYSWGADNHPNGGTAQADVLGIFGREGLDLATRWVAPPAGSPAFRAFQMYRNVDGTNGGFGDVSVRATTPNPDQVSAFAAERAASGDLTVMVVNKDPSTNVEATISFTNFPHAGFASIWRMSGTQAIARLPDTSFTSNLTLTLPAQSVTLVVLPGKPKLAVAPSPSPSGLMLSLDGPSNAVYAVEESANLSTWLATTSTLPGQSSINAPPSTNSTRFFRVRRSF